MPEVRTVAESGEDHRPAMRAGLDRRLVLPIAGRIIGIDAVDGTCRLIFLAKSVPCSRKTSRMRYA